MANLAPVLLALILNVCGYYLFRSPKPPPNGIDAPLMSSIFFAFAIAVLVLDTRLYPCTFRTLHWFINYVYQYLVATFLIEYSLNDFWFPFEYRAMKFLPAFGDFLVDLIRILGFGCGGICSMVEMLHQPEVIFAWSYFLSTMFLSCVLHSTRIIDVRILMRCGPGLFLKDVGKNIRHIRNKIMCEMAVCRSTCPPANAPKRRRRCCPPPLPDNSDEEVENACDACYT